MIAIRGLALAAVAGALAIAFAPRAAAEPGRASLGLEARHVATRSPLDNYLALARQIERACKHDGVRGLDMRKQERACARETMDRLVGRMDRAGLAAIHDFSIGRPADSFRMPVVR